jgi:hypothetical protein
MSERITWVRCLSCGGPAVVGWIGDEPVEFDCPEGCAQLAGQLDGIHLAHGRAVSFLIAADLSLATWSRDLCLQSALLREQARIAVQQSRSSVIKSRALRAIRHDGAHP